MSKKADKEKNAKNAHSLNNDRGKRENCSRFLAENSRDIIIIQDIQGKIIYVNPAWMETTGYSAEETQGKSVNNFASPEYLDEIDEIYERYEQRKAGKDDVYSYEVKIISKQGEKIPLEIKGTPFAVGKGKTQEILLIARDIREHKKTETALKRQLNELNILQATAFTSSQATDQEMLIRQITNIIGNTLYPDNFGILLLNENTKTLETHPSYRGISKGKNLKTISLSQGIAGKVASTGKTLRIANVNRYPEYKMVTPSTRSELCVPIKTGERILGVINAESTKKDFFTQDDERLLSTIAGQMAISIEKIRLLKTEQNRRQIAEKLQESAAILTTTLSQEKAITLILEELSQVVSFDSASIQLIGNGYLEIVGGRGALVLETEKNRRFPFPSDNPNTIVVETGRPLSLGNAPATYPAFLEMPSIQSWLGVPLIAHERTIGILTLDSGKVDHFTEEDTHLVSSFANHAAIAIENARLFNAEQKRRQEAETLRETALAITASLNLEEAVQHILEQLSRVLPYDSASVQILQDGYLQLFGGRGWRNPEEVKKLCFSLDGSNPNTRVILAKEIVILDDAPVQHAPFRLPPHDHILSWMGVPLIIRDKVVGMLAVDSKEKGYFTEEDAKIAQSFASQAAIAVENARLFDAEQARRQEAETLRQAALTISSSLNLKEVLDTVLASIKHVIPYDSAAIMLFDGGQIRLTGGRDLPNMKSQIGKTFPADDPLSHKIIKNSHPLILADAQESPYFKKWAETDYVRGWMGVPLIVRGKVIGYITLDSRTVNAYQPKDAELAQTFAHQAASAIENARLYQEALLTAERRTILHRLGQDISHGIRSPETTYLAIHRATEELMRCDAFIISLRGKSTENDDEAIYLIDLGKRYSPKMIPRESSIISFTEKMKGSFISKDLAIEDPQTHVTRFGSNEKVRSLLVSPMYVGKKLIGAISAQSYDPNIYGEEEKVLLEMLASHAAAAIENARLFYETERRAREFAELYKLTQDLIAPQEMESLLKTTLKRAAHMIGTSSGDIYLYDSNTEELKVVVGYGLPQEYKNKIEGMRLSKGEGMAGHVAETLKPLRIDDYQVWEGKSQKYNDIPFTSVLEVPMLYAGNLIGVLALYEMSPNTRYFTEEDERIMTLFATQVAGAIHSARQFEQINSRLAELETVNRTSIALRSAETPEEMLPILLKEVGTSLNIEVCAIWLSNPDTKEVYRADSCGWIKDTQPECQRDDVGLIGHIYQSGESHIAPNLSEDPYVQLAKGDKFPNGWTGAWVPIRSTDAIIGVISTIAEIPRKFNSGDIRLLTTLAEMAGNAIHRARLHTRTEKQVKHLTALRNIDSAISANFDLQVTLQLLIDHTVSQLGIDAANILLTESRTQNLNFFVGRGFKTTLFSNTKLRAGEGLPDKAIQDHLMQSFRFPYKEENCRRKSSFIKENFLHYFCIPLIAKGKTLGVLEVFHRENISPPREWKDFLHALAGQAAIAIDNNYLFEDLKRSNQELALAYDTTLEGWGKALELRDKETQGHTLNVTELTLKLACEMDIPESDLTHIYRGALLHDIGKMGIPDNILRKPGPLTKDEWEIMRQHPRFAYDMISPIPYLLPALDIPYCHHERWDGGGYPRGLKGDEIPLAARIFSVIDVWDALLSDRPYRDAWPKKVVIRYIINESGSRFDPEIVEAFIKMVNKPT